MTNAHVVGGTQQVVVKQPSGKSYTATVVLFDPQRDVAVLDVPSLHATPLPFTYDGKSGDDAIVIGYPQNGPYTPVAARIRQEITATGANIYNSGNVRRDVYSLYATVLQGKTNPTDTTQVAATGTLGPYVQSFPTNPANGWSTATQTAAANYGWVYNVSGGTYTVSASDTTGTATLTY